ncbi:MAG: NAD(+) synthase [Clostridia bacterium]|nr:NAD(+) synthase [Clostridia bacterium]
MKDGFVKVACATTDIKVGDTKFNSDNIIAQIKEAADNKAKLIVFPELSVTAYTCGDLFLQNSLIKSAESEILRIASQTKGCDIISVVGFPFVVNQTLYNCAAVINKGHIKGIVPKMSIPNYSEFYEARHFAKGIQNTVDVKIGDSIVPFGSKILFRAKNMADFILAVEICEDLWTVNPPSCAHALAGATIIANLSASNELIAKDEYRSMLVSSQSARLFSAYLYADAGYGESTTDVVFAGDNIIAENGTLLKRSKRFTNECVYTELDLERLVGERRKTTTYENSMAEDYTVVEVEFNEEETEITRHIEKLPFVPADEEKRVKRSEEILTIQSMGLKKRLQHAWAKTAVVGVSGGLDSTLALLVTVRAFDSLGLDRKNIMAITMPCFGTTSRTYNNSINFANSLGVTLKEINIKDAVNQHFKDIEQEPEKYDVTYENSQARERTQILMDIANKNNGIVVGTGDLSELALGWATYNGDHMSMYAVNASVPKTLIRYLVDYEAKRTENEMLKKTLQDILATPVSPELLPPKDGEISQKTEHIVGPYELHDFFLYHLVRFASAPSKIFRLAKIAFNGVYDSEFILSWMKVFYKRFFQQQFKRSCLPDGPKVGSVALSPRGDWRMPSDASVNLWMSEIEKL